MTVDSSDNDVAPNHTFKRLEEDTDEIAQGDVVTPKQPTAEVLGELENITPRLWSDAMNAIQILLAVIVLGIEGSLAGEMRSVRRDAVPVWLFVGSYFVITGLIGVYNRIRPTKHMCYLYAVFCIQGVVFSCIGYVLSYIASYSLERQMSYEYFYDNEEEYILAHKRGAKYLWFLTIFGGCCIFVSTANFVMAAFNLYGKTEPLGDPPRKLMLILCLFLLVSSLILMINEGTLLGIYGLYTLRHTYIPTWLLTGSFLTFLSLAMIESEINLLSKLPTMRNEATQLAFKNFLKSTGIILATFGYILAAIALLVNGTMLWVSRRIKEEGYAHIQATFWLNSIFGLPVAMACCALAVFNWIYISNQREKALKKREE